MSRRPNDAASPLRWPSVKVTWQEKHALCRGEGSADAAIRNCHCSGVSARLTGSPSSLRTPGGSRRSKVIILMLSSCWSERFGSQTSTTLDESNHYQQQILRICRDNVSISSVSCDPQPATSGHVADVRASGVTVRRPWRGRVRTRDRRSRYVSAGDSPADPGGSVSRGTAGVPSPDSAGGTVKSAGHSRRRYS